MVAAPGSRPRGAGVLKRPVAAAALRRLRAPQHDADAREQLPQPEGLHDIVVGAELQADDLVDLLATMTGDDSACHAGTARLAVRLATTLGPCPMARAARGLQARPHVAIHEMAHHCRLSGRHFFRCFTLGFGLRPKHFARLARMEFALAAWRQGASWAEAACTGGYADQAHSVRDFKRMTGTPPERLLRRSASRRGHAFDALLAASGFANVFLETSGIAQ
jgi:AraC-like DNA-binding protein